MAKYITLDNLSTFKTLMDTKISEADAKAIKVVEFDETSRTIKFYKTETVTEGQSPAYSVVIPDDVDISGLMSKIEGGTVGNVVTVAADGEVADGGVALADIALKSEVEAVDEKIGTLADLETTNKADLVVAINEVRNAVSAGGTDAALSCDTSTTTDGMLKSYTLKQGSNVITTIDIPRDLVVISGTVETNPEGQAEGTYIKLVIANQTDPLYINVGTLVDLYTAKADATQVQLTVDNSTREISAVIVAGSITSTELATDAVTTVKIADGNVTLAKLNADVTGAFDTKGSAATAEQNAKDYVDSLIGEAVTDEEIEALFT